MTLSTAQNPFNTNDQELKMIMNPQVRFSQVPTNNLLQAPPAPQAPPNAFLSPRTMTGFNGKSLQGMNLAGGLNAIQQEVNAVPPGTNPVHKLSTLQGQINDILDHVRFLQAENDLLRSRAGSRARVMMSQWFGQADKVLKQAVFWEWKQIWSKSVHAARAEETSSEIRTQERDRYHQVISQHQSESENRFRTEVRTAKADERSRFEANLREMEAAFADREEEQTRIHQAEMEQVTKDCEQKVQRAAEEYQKLATDYHKLEEDFKKTKDEFARCNNVVNILRNSIADYKEDPTIAAQCQLQEAKLPQDAAVTYVKNALHEVLYSIDPRYLGRSNLPTVREIAIEERAAYQSAKEANGANAVDASSKGAMNNNTGMGTPRMLNPIEPLQLSGAGGAWHGQLYSNQFGNQ